MLYGLLLVDGPHSRMVWANMGPFRPIVSVLSIYYKSDHFRGKSGIHRSTSSIRVIQDHPVTASIAPRVQSKKLRRFQNMSRISPPLSSHLKCLWFWYTTMQLLVASELTRNKLEREHSIWIVFVHVYIYVYTFVLHISVHWHLQFVFISKNSSGGPRSGF